MISGQAKKAFAFVPSVVTMLGLGEMSRQVLQ